MSMKITLYKAAEQFGKILDQIDPETGEIPEGLLEEYDNLKGLVKNRAAAVAAYVRSEESLQAAAELAMKEQAAELAASKARVSWLKIYLRDNMRASGITEIKGEGLKIKLHPNRDSGVVIFDPKQLPPEAFADPKPPEPSKTKIKQIIEAGREVPGAYIEKRDRLEIKG